MKKTLLSIIYFLGCIVSIKAQTLYGTTSGGGNDGAGTISAFTPATNSLIVAKSFEGSPDGSYASGGLMQASDGKLYGVTVNGGSGSGTHGSAGVIYSFDPSSSIYTKLKDFNYADGTNPYGGLVQATDGKLYGVTAYGGSNDTGVIFSFEPSTSTYTKLKDFNTNIGANPSGPLIQARDGKLYGTTSNGGTSVNGGVIFSFDPSTSTYTTHWYFDIINGSHAINALQQASDGKLYGTTAWGGSSGAGVIYSFDPSSSTYTKLMDFDMTNGGLPQCKPVLAGDGKLYGITNRGGSNDLGVLFSFDPSTSTYTKLKDFDGATPCCFERANASPHLLQASDGKLYGMASVGGSSGVGFIFSFDPSSSTYTKLKDYNGDNGANPNSGFIEVKSCTDTTWYLDADGDSYGNPDSSILACIQPEGYVKTGGDCNDNIAATHAGVTYYRDEDKDGFGDPNTSISSCENKRPVGYVRNNYDCDDHFKANRIINQKLLMCHNGKEACVRIIFVLRKLFQGWKLGSCFSNADLARGTIDDAEIIEMLGKEELIPRQYKLSNYPNPFVGTSTIKYELPFDSRVSIKVYDLMGRVVATLINEDKKAGTYTVDFKAGDISRGSLYYRMTAKSKDNQFEQTNKMIQLR